MEGFIGSALGWVGTVGTFSAYVLLWRGRLSSEALRYSLLNACGGMLAAAGAFAYGAWPAVVSNLLWSLIGIHGFIMAISRRHAVAARARRAPLTSETRTDDAVHTAGVRWIDSSNAHETEWDPTFTYASSIRLPWLESSRTERAAAREHAPV